MFSPSLSLLILSYFQFLVYLYNSCFHLRSLCQFFSTSRAQCTCIVSVFTFHVHNALKYIALIHAFASFSGRQQFKRRGCILLRRFTAPAFHQVSGEGRVVKFSFPEGLSQAVRVHYEEKQVILHLSRKFWISSRTIAVTVLAFLYNVLLELDLRVFIFIYLFIIIIFIYAQKPYQLLKQQQNLNTLIL